MKKKKPNKLIGSWQITEERGTVYEGDTHERLEQIKAELLKKGRTFKLVQTNKRRVVSKDGHILYAISSGEEKALKGGD